jgi:hypothetical protein
MKLLELKTLICAVLLLACSGCAVLRAPKRAYVFAYCNDRIDRDHCKPNGWATTCGRLDCAGR